MKKLALAFSSKDRVELSERTIIPFLKHDDHAVLWLDGSKTQEGESFFNRNAVGRTIAYPDVFGGPDRAIVFALTQMLTGDYTHVGVLENDVLLDYDWLEPALALFDYSRTEGLPIGAVSARSYADRVLIQRDGYGVMHNIGAGHVILTREAASIILNNYRTGWWGENRRVFSQICQTDIGKFGAFGFNEQATTADWSWDTILAAHGLTTVALTPSKASMIGQEVPLAQLGLKLVQSEVADRKDELTFERYRESLINIQEGRLRLPKVDHCIRTGNSILIPPHQVGKHRGRYAGQWRTRWNQATGPFTYVAQENGANLVIPLFGQAAFHVGEGKVAIRDAVTNFSTDLDLTDNPGMVTIPIPRDMHYGKIEVQFGKGAVLHGIECVREQPEWDVPFDYNTLPEPM